MLMACFVASKSLLVKVLQPVCDRLTSLVLGNFSNEMLVAVQEQCCELHVQGCVICFCLEMEGEDAGVRIIVGRLGNSGHHWL